MAFARVVSFEGVNADRVAQVASEIENDPRPDDIPATEILMLHDPDAERSLVIQFFDTVRVPEKCGFAGGTRFLAPTTPHPSLDSRL